MYRDSIERTLQNHPAYLPSVFRLNSRRTTAILTSIQSTYSNEHQPRSTTTNKEQAAPKPKKIMVPQPIRSSSSRAASTIEPRASRAARLTIITNTAQDQRGREEEEGTRTARSEQRSEANRSDAPRKARNTKRKVKPLADHQRPSKLLWWLAGGQLGGRRTVPTAGELRDRKVLEGANRAEVGFWGTVRGKRAVRGKRIVQDYEGGGFGGTRGERLDEGEGVEDESETERGDMTRGAGGLTTERGAEAGLQFAVPPERAVKNRGGGLRR